MWQILIPMVAGALLDKKKPLRGAAIGGTLGAVMGPGLMGAKDTLPSLSSELAGTAEGGNLAQPTALGRFMGSESFGGKALKAVGQNPQIATSLLRGQESQPVVGPALHGGQYQAPQNPFLVMRRRRR